MFLGEKWRLFLTGIDGVWYCFVSILNIQPRRKDAYTKMRLLVGAKKNFIGWTLRLMVAECVRCTGTERARNNESQMALQKWHRFTSFMEADSRILTSLTVLLGWRRETQGTDGQ